jgi:hypothetical protein
MRGLIFKPGILRKTAAYITVYNEKGEEVGAVGLEAFQAFSDGQIRITTTWSPRNKAWGRYLKEDEKVLCNEVVPLPEGC